MHVNGNCSVLANFPYGISDYRSHYLMVRLKPGTMIIFSFLDPYLNNSHSNFYFSVCEHGNSRINGLIKTKLNRDV
jgi:hypothetical protein